MMSIGCAIFLCALFSAPPCKTKMRKIHYIFVDMLHFVVYNDDMEKRKYYIDAVLKKEIGRNENMQKAYAKRILELPRGSLMIRELNGRQYCYLRYREGQKVVQKYAGTIAEADALRAQIAQRKHLLALLTMLKEEHARMMKMEAVR